MPKSQSEMKELEKRTKLVWSKQAETILKNLDEDFPIEAFEAWVEKNFFKVGGSQIIQFLEEQEKLRDVQINDNLNV